MKNLKSCTAAVLALLAADAAFADTIKITGSTAFRSATITSIQSLLTAGYDVAYSGTDVTKAQYATYVGTYAGNPVTVQCSWTGSVEGVRDVSKGLTQPFIKAAYVTATAATSGAPTVTTDAAVYESTIPDISLSDNTQGATSYTSPALKETKVAVIPFVFIKGVLGASHPAAAAFGTVNNITGNMAQSLLGGGVNLSALIGAVDGSGTKVYALGRNNLSGTRLVTFAETGFGAKSSAVQFKPTISGSNITAVDLYPADAIFTTAGDNGYSSGGTLAGDLTKVVTDTDGSGNLFDGVPFALIGYTGVGDAATAESTGGTILSYNGVSIRSGGAWDFTPIKEGKYSLWSYEYLAYRKSAGPNSTTALAGQALTFATAMTTNIIANVPSTSAVKLSDMHVQRASEGAVITP